MSTKILAMIPRVQRIQRAQLARLTAEKKFSSFAEAFAGLRGLLGSPRYAGLSHVILVVSTQPEEGKTITASNLAITYAMAGQKTLLVDFDLRRPRVGRIYEVNAGKDRSKSLVDVLSDEGAQPFESLPFPSGYENLDLVVSIPSSNISPATIMGSESLERFFEWARKNYERVVIDSPPFGLVSDSLALGVFSDSVLMVCRPEQSRYRAIRHALRSLLESGARVIGVIVNDVDFKSGGGFSSYGYSKSYKYNRYGRYGRYGYGYGYYHRSPTSEELGVDADGTPDPSPASSVLDVEDDE